MLKPYIHYQGQLKARSPADMFLLAEVKRFLETYVADEKFRTCVHNGERHQLVDSLQKLGIRTLDSEQIAPLWKKGFREDLKISDLDGYPLALDWVNLIKERMVLRDELRIAADQYLKDESFRFWRSIVRRQNEASLNPGFLTTNVYPIFAIELTSGCSVGCPFCGVGALGLTDSFRGSIDNISLFKSLLRVLKTRFGEHVGAFGFCYWATDPLDNPDYEQFVDAYHEELFYIPQITTALPTKDFRRTRKLIEMYPEYRVAPHRFSILSTGMLRRLYNEFSTVDLLEVELIAQTRDSLVRKAAAGKNLKNGKDKGPTGDTIACVAGYLINLPQRVVKLVSPCSASDKFPLGYRVHAERTFKDAAEFDVALCHIQGASMPRTLGPDTKVALWDEFETSDLAKHGIMRGKYRTFELDLTGSEYDIASILLTNGACLVQDLIKQCVSQGVDVFQAISGVQELYSQGLLATGAIEGDSKSPG